MSSAHPARSLPPAKRKRKTKRRSRQAFPVKTIIGATICTLLAFGGIAFAVYLLPRIIDNVNQKIADASRVDFHGYSFEVPSGLQYKESREGDMEFEGKYIGTNDLMAFKHGEPGGIVVAFFTLKTDADITDPDVREFLRTTDSMTSLKKQHLYDPLKPVYTFSNEELTSINGLKFAVAEYTGEIVNRGVKGKSYYYRDGKIVLEFSAVASRGRHETVSALLDEMVQTIRRIE